MLFAAAVAALALVPASWAFPSLQLRDATTVVNDIANINSSISTLNSTLNTFRPDEILGVATALLIQQQTTSLGDSVQTATTATEASSNFTSDQSNQVAAAVLNLEPNIQSLLSNIVAHKPAFATAVLLVGDLSKTVHGDLVKQANLTQALGNAITAKLAAPYSDFAPLITGQINGYFTSAIEKYETCSGVLCLPDVSSL